MAELPSYSGVTRNNEQSLFQSSGPASPTTETLRKKWKRTSYVLGELVVASISTPHHLHGISALRDFAK